MIGQKLTIDRQLGERIRSARLELNLSRAALGVHLGLTVDQVIKLENGDMHISSERLTEIAAALGKSISFFFEGWAARPPSSSFLVNAGEYEPATVGALDTALSGGSRRLLSIGSVRHPSQLDRDHEADDETVIYLQ